MPGAIAEDRCGWTSQHRAMGAMAGFSPFECEGSPQVRGAQGISGLAVRRMLLTPLKRAGRPHGGLHNQVSSRMPSSRPLTVRGNMRCSISSFIIWMDGVYSQRFTGSGFSQIAFG
jgi:hypothetical protein